MNESKNISIATRFKSGKTRQEAALQEATFHSTGISCNFDSSNKIEEKTQNRTDTSSDYYHRTNNPTEFFNAS